MKINRILYITTFIIFQIIVLLAGCSKLEEPVATADSAIDELDEPVNFEGDQSSDASPDVVENFGYTITPNQQEIVLQWDAMPGNTYTLIKSINPDCNPLDPTSCSDYDIFDNVSSPYTDSDIKSGNTYYYWLVGSPVSISTSSATISARKTEQVVSKPLIIALDFDDSSLGIQLTETIDSDLLKKVTLTRTSNDVVTVEWTANPDMLVTIYSSLESDCDVLDSTANCAQVSVHETPGSNSKISIAPNASIDDYYFWVHAKHYIPLLNDGGGQTESRLYGAMRSYNNSPTNDKSFQTVKLFETADFDSHSLSASFTVPSSLVYQFANYNFYLISGDAPANSDLIDAVLATNPVNTLSKLKNMAGAKGQKLSYQQLDLNSNSLGLTQLSTGNLYVELGDIEGAIWYTLIVTAEENGQYVLYQPTARRSLQRLRIDAKGDNGLWQIKNKTTNELLFAKKSSGFYYPAIDWRNLKLEAKLAFPNKQAYYFTGCGYYEDKPELGTANKLYNNECHFAQRNPETDELITVLTKPMPVKVFFERKANAQACNDYQLLPAHGYNRSRYNKLDAYGEAICDHRIQTYNSNGDKNSFAMIYPHGEPTEIANSPVEQWYGGTQVPIYLSGTEPLPVAPDGIVTATSCSDLGDGQECTFSEEITVIRCNGYYVYQLAEPSGCSVSYAWEESEIAALHRKATESNSE